jgi:hypothetical protein
LLRAGLAELIDGLERFNRRWLPFVAALDLRHINELRDGRLRLRAPYHGVV